MSTRFFENQDAARRNTKWLVVLFGVAVVFWMITITMGSLVKPLVLPSPQPSPETT